MSQPKPKPKPKWPRLTGILAGVVLAVVCTYLPAKYQAACEALSQITSLTCGT